ncbi:hypothetical protein K474DRAFT_1769667 [Panus rudis PR-1116 ss-1]|nr:hypothetical protein K474DRAFT_1769667 [Panus rudis PR-1116 ss-1]
MSSAFAAAAKIKQDVTYLDLVAAAVLMYDYILTLPREIQYVWPSKMSLGKVLFLMTRYPVFAETTLVLYHQFAVMGPGTCDAVYKTIGFQLGTGTLIAETILAMRTWVIWHRNKYVGLALASGLVLFWTPVFYFLAQALNSLVFTNPPNPNTPGCFLLSQKDILFVVFILISCFETLILALTLVRFTGSYSHSRTSLIRVIYRDGVLNYVYLATLSICNVVVLTTAPHGYSTLLSALQRCIHSILSARVLLNMREAVNNPQGQQSQIPDLTTMSYRSRPGPQFANDATLVSILGLSTNMGETQTQLNIHPLKEMGRQHDDDDDSSGHITTQQLSELPEIGHSGEPRATSSRDAW